MEKLIPLISWTYFFWPWRVKEDSEEGQKLRADADKLLQDLCKEEYAVRAVQAFYPAAGTENSIVVQLRQNGHESACPCCKRTIEIPTPRQNNPEGECLALCDYIAPESKLGMRDYVGAFACTVSDAFAKRLEKLKTELGGSDYDVLLLQTIGDRLAEAGAEYLSKQLEQNNQWKGIRPAVGYPSLPDQKTIFTIAKMIDYAGVGILLTENGAMYPQASVSGLYIAHPEAKYFSVK